MFSILTNIFPSASFTGTYIRNGHFFVSLFLFGCISNALHQVMFQETYSLSFWWLLIEQTQYQNMDMIFEEIFLQGANLHNFRSVVKIGPSPRWNLVPNCYFRKIFNVIFRTIYPHKEYLFVHDWFFSWFSTEI